MPMAVDDALDLRRLSAALDRLGEGIALFDSQDLLVTCNLAYTQLWADAGVRIEPGMSHADMLREALATGCFPEAAADEDAWLKARLAAHRLDQHVHERQTVDGRWIRMETRTTDDGGLICSSVDITDVKAREADAQEARAFLDAIIEGVPAPLVVKDAAGSFLVLNRAGEEMLGVLRRDHYGKTGYDIFPRAQAERFAEEDRQVLESGELKVIEEEAVETPNNGLRYLRTKKIAVRAGGGRKYLVAISEDITERKRTDQALQSALEQAEAANRAKSLFLGNISHEIRTPLNGVSAVADVLASSPLNEAQRELVEIVRSSARMVDILLADILELSRIDGGREETVRGAFHLADALRDRTDLYAASAASKGLDLRLEIDPAAEAWVDGDCVRLKQIVGVLLSNAVKFTSSGEVRVAARRAESDRFLIQVSDTGEGFDRAQKARLFERFTQGDASSTRRHGGAGLGLALARDCAELMGAELDCESEPGHGAVFTLTVPLAPACAPEAAANGPAAQDAGADEPIKDFRALIVDDNPTNRKVLELILDQVGASWMSVEDGRQAVAAYEAGRFSVVLMDIQMPVMDGLAATREIRRLERTLRRSPTPVIIVSANCMPEHVEAGLAAGAQQHLAKPVNANALISAISDVLEHEAEAEDAAAGRYGS